MRRRVSTTLHCLAPCTPRVKKITKKRISCYAALCAMDEKTAKKLAPRYRALRAMAMAGHDHLRIHMFMKGEERAKRALPTTGRAAKTVSWLYDMGTDFGYSVLRPTLGWIGQGLICALLYPLFSYKELSAAAFGSAAFISFKNSLPFIGAGRQAVEGAYQDLYGPSVASWIGAVELFQSVFAFTCLFFMGLALRNLFRLR